MTTKTPAQAHALNHWYKVWLSSREERVAPSRVQSDRARYERYIAPRLGDVPVDKLTTKRVASWSEALLNKGVGAFTVAACVLILRQSLDLAVEAGERRHNPVGDLQVAETSGLRKREESEILSEEEFERLVECMAPLYKALVLMAGLLGVTWAEALGLRVTDVDFASGFVNVGKTLAVETNGHIEYRPGTPRRITMPRRLTEALAAYVLSSQSLRERADEPWLFLAQRVPKHPLRSNFNTFYLRPALKAAGLDPRAVTFHTLRHTAAAHMLMGGVDPQEVSTTLGHSSLVTTKRYYADFFPKAKPQKASV